VADQRHARPGELADEVVDVGQVVDEVVIAARPDPVAVAVAAEVGCDEVEAPGQARGGGPGPPPGQIEEAVQENDRVVELRAVGPPLEDVVVEAGRERDPARQRLGRRHSTTIRWIVPPSMLTT
jgi:hypothetical protein